MSHLKKMLIVASLIIAFFAFNKSVLAIEDEGSGSAGACYCCGGSSGCAYDWKLTSETIGGVPGNCAKIKDKTEANCHGTATASGSGACWYCGQVYKWTSNGASPESGCSYISGMGETACYGTIDDHDPGVGEHSNNEYPDYEDPDGPDVGFISGDASCSGIIGSGNFRGYLTDILNAMRIVAVAMVIVFSTLDFGKALITQDNDAMKKASEKTTKRLALAIVIFFVPILLNILLSLVGIDRICI